jgi:hypothetical protein
MPNPMGMSRSRPTHWSGTAAIRAKRRRWVNALAHVPGEVSVDAGVDEVPVSGNVAASSAAI